jgi:hypothetical protein
MSNRPEAKDKGTKKMQRVCLTLRGGSMKKTEFVVSAVLILIGIDPAGIT